jgi:hypothetical protein
MADMAAIPLASEPAAGKYEIHRCLVRGAGFRLFGRMK